MGKLIAIVGNTGVGKTTLAHALCSAAPFESGLEQHTERPFQALFDKNKRYALANQIDYLLLRAEQERILRASPIPALIDGGLEQDFFGFTQLFHARGYLSNDELTLLRRFYTELRQHLPPPELIIHLHADVDIIQTRLESRDRINIATPQDLTLLASLLDQWLGSLEASRVLRLDVSHSAPNYADVIPEILQKTNSLISNYLV